MTFHSVNTKPPLSNFNLVAILAISLSCLFTSLTTGCSRSLEAALPATKILNITGSDTMVHLVTHWAEAYRKDHPHSEIAVNGGGSGNGIAALLNGTADIAPSSRNLKPDEKKRAHSNQQTLKETPIAVDAIAIVTHKDNPLQKISLEQAQSVFTGKFTRWQQLGGNNKLILVYSRESSSGTFEFFQEHVLKKQDFTLSARMIPSTAAIIEAVKQDTNSIGYVGLGYALQAKDKVKIIPITGANNTVIWPSPQNVYSKHYPIARYLYLYSGQKIPPEGKAFLSFCQTPQGQKIVANNGFLPLKQIPEGTH